MVNQKHQYLNFQKVFYVLIKWIQLILFHLVELKDLLIYLEHEIILIMIKLLLRYKFSSAPPKKLLFVNAKGESILFHRH